ncbi:MAG: hypothetical protein IPM98_15660 [Lewinellaceae bacterium]|nr:hypothetical protein [Lewinellaceae bacterium]
MYDFVVGEYYIDTDPGVGNGTPIAVTPGSNLVDMAFPVDLSGAAHGFHRLVVRFRNAAGRWSLSNDFYFIKGGLPVLSPAPSAVLAAEYFIDQDPGFGQATPVVITSGADIAGLLFGVNLTGLTDGLHTLQVRSRDNRGSWSHTVNYMFLKGSLPVLNAGIPNLQTLEYFIDTDPGFGNGAGIALSANTEDVAFGIDLTGLTDGLHTLQVRSRNDSGDWSHTGSYVFLKGSLPASVDNLPNVQKLEYFIDADPGIGNGTSIALPTGSEAPDFAFTVDISALSKGTHHLRIRVFDADGNVSLTQDRYFIKVNPVFLPTTNISALEYYFNTDPGIGNGTLVTLPAGIQISNYPLVIDLTALPFNTFHTLYIRSKDVDGQWSLLAYKTFYKHPLVPNPYGGAIVRLEYYFDTDPGFGQAIEVPVTAAPELDQVTFPVDIGSLANGLHQLHLRSKDSWAGGRYPIRSFL